MKHLSFKAGILCNQSFFITKTFDSQLKKRYATPHRGETYRFFNYMSLFQSPSLNPEWHDVLKIRFVHLIYPNAFFSYGVQGVIECLLIRVIEYLCGHS